MCTSTTTRWCSTRPAGCSPGSADGVAYLDADARDVPKIVEQASRTLDFSQPVAVLLIAVLHCVPDEDDPWDVVARLAGATAAGSHIALTHPSLDWDPGRAAAGVGRLNTVLAQRTDVPSPRGGAALLRRA